MKSLTTGVTLRKRDATTDAEFSFDFDDPGDYYESVQIVYRLLQRSRPDETLEHWYVAETREVLVADCLA